MESAPTPRRRRDPSPEIYAALAPSSTRGRDGTVREPGWLCNFCNTDKIPLLDARTTAEYELYQGRLYVNCTTFP